MEGITRLEIEFFRFNSHAGNVNFFRRAAHFNQLVLPKMADGQHQLTLLKQITVILLMLVEDVTTRDIRPVKHRCLFAFQDTQFTQFIRQRPGIAEMHQENIRDIGLTRIGNDRRQQQLTGLCAIAAHVKGTE